MPNWSVDTIERAAGNRTTLIQHKGKLHTARLQRSTIACAPCKPENLFVITKRQVDSALRLVTGLEQVIDCFHNADERALAI